MGACCDGASRRSGIARPFHCFLIGVYPETSVQEDGAGWQDRDYTNNVKFSHLSILAPGLLTLRPRAIYRTTRGHRHSPCHPFPAVSRPRGLPFHLQIPDPGTTTSATTRRPEAPASRTTSVSELGDLICSQRIIDTETQPPKVTTRQRKPVLDP
ncbi:hypothetical protein BDM02DRAFT_3125400 [Thelephora ganbajun]|uniref:Uncharacterized protein n=1 Tax=Thelephora ganbajun TaxID=370292 RepID=A0ACB6ZWL0_THEGA|nr:hypothetical protein BDM02DRAFT_3125400 [Thelephora ganbajun]